MRSLARGEYPALGGLGVEQVRGDVADADVVLRAVEGCDVVFHTAAKAGLWGPYEDYYRTNVEALRPLHEWTRTFERLWRHQLTRVKARAEGHSK